MRRSAERAVACGFLEELLLSLGELRDAVGRAALVDTPRAKWRHQPHIHARLCQRIRVREQPWQLVAKPVKQQRVLSGRCRQEGEVG